MIIESVEHPGHFDMTLFQTYIKIKRFNFLFECVKFKSKVFAPEKIIYFIICKLQIPVLSYILILIRHFFQIINQGFKSQLYHR